MSLFNFFLFVHKSVSAFKEQNCKVKKRKNQAKCPNQGPGFSKVMNKNSENRCQQKSQRNCWSRAIVFVFVLSSVLPSTILQQKVGQCSEQVSTGPQIRNGVVLVHIHLKEAQKSLLEKCLSFAVFSFPILELRRQQLFASCAFTMGRTIFGLPRATSRTLNTSLSRIAVEKGNKQHSLTSCLN